MIYLAEVGANRLRGGTACSDQRDECLLHAPSRSDPETGCESMASKGRMHMVLIVARQ